MEDIRDYIAVIGLEVHAQLLTQRKLFSSETVTYGSLPNTCTSATSLAHPGTLPVLDKQAVDLALRLGLACQAEITHHNHFDRKNYFYADLPKGFQITQHTTPICKHGHLVVDLPQGQQRNMRLQRIHLEEDTGKSIHDLIPDHTLLDYNRAGMALVEIVTEPDMHTGDEAYHFLRALRKLVRYLDVCDGNMEEGSLRCDANVSVMHKDSGVLGQKVEVKNMNSMSHVRLAIAYEIERQKQQLAAGKPVIAETRAYDAVANQTLHQRLKESAVDYHYMPEPDLSPFVVDAAWIAEIRAQLPPMPWELLDILVKRYQLSAYDAGILTESKDVALFFQALCRLTKHYKAAANWVLGPVKSYLNKYKLTMEAFPLDAPCMAELVNMVQDDLISFSTASQRLFPALLEAPLSKPRALAKDLGLLQRLDNNQLVSWTQRALDAYPDKVAAYKKGKKGLLGFFMGEIMRQSQGKAHPQQAEALLRKHLDNSAQSG